MTFTFRLTRARRVYCDHPATADTAAVNLMRFKHEVDRDLTPNEARAAWDIAKRLEMLRSHPSSRSLL